MIKIDLEGMEGFQRKLKLYVGKKRQMIEKETAKAAINIHRAAVRRVPVDEARLKTSIHFIINGLNAEVVAGSDVGSVDYAAFQEFGTGRLMNIPPEMKDIASKFRGAGVRQVHIPPTPFMYPSLVEERPKYVNRVNKALGHEEI